MGVPRYVRIDAVDQTFGLPPGVALSWVSLGFVPLVWFVDHGEITRGVPVRLVRPLVDHRRAFVVHREISRTRAAPGSLGSNRSIETPDEEWVHG